MCNSRFLLLRGLLHGLKHGLKHGLLHELIIASYCQVYLLGKTIKAHDQEFADYNALKRRGRINIRFLKAFFSVI